MEKALEDYLKEHNINYIEHKHPAVFTVEQSKEIKLNIPGMHTKNLFLKDDKGNFYLMCMNAHKRLDIKSLKKKLSLTGKLHFGSEEELKQQLNLTPGSVSIFGMIYSSNVLLLIDKEVWQAPIIGSHPNINTSTLEITHENLEKFLHSLKSKFEIINLDE